MIKKWALLRSDNENRRYRDVLEERSRLGKPPLLVLEEEALKIFDYWFIADNIFPYDTIATTHHLLFPRREGILKWSDLNNEELQELQDLREKYFCEEYEMISENMPKNRTGSSHFHLHLLVLKRKEL
jgi:diadenosine tetraphosphate (Ap4A) HIT family hydrolase